MIAYKFEKLRKWVQVTNDGLYRSVPFGHSAINSLNSMRSGKDFEMFKRMYANQISPYMLGGYYTESAKKNILVVENTLQDESKMKKKFDIVHNAYTCVESSINTMFHNLQIIHNYRKTDKKKLYQIYSASCDLALRFNQGITQADKVEMLESDYEEYEKAVFGRIQWKGAAVFDNEYTDSQEEIAEIYEITPNDLSSDNIDCEWFMFPLDYMELLFNQDLNFIVKECSHCGALFVTSYPQTVYCDCCRSFNIPNTIRKNNKCRQLHKNIMDLINNCKDNKIISRYAGLVTPDNTPTYHFRTESNYYWALCQHKKPKTEKMIFYEDITTEKQYYDWLTKIHEEIKSQK